MAKKILVLNGSPRPSGNTAALIEAFTEGAQSAGHTVVRFDLCRMKIGGCLGCCRGGKDPEAPCVQKDDMLKIYPEYRSADIVIFASPMYYWGFSSQLKAAIDRLFAVAELDPNYRNPIKTAGMLMAAEDNFPNTFEPIRFYFTSMAENLGWSCCGMVCAGGNLEAGAILKKPEQLAEARALGASL